jgi:selenocysteine lyase/cysteine desulfurase
MSFNRRNFIRTVTAGMAASLMFNTGTQGAGRIGSLPEGGEGMTDDETWWKFVKAQFSLEENLLYFNNGSLGPSPEYVIDKTEHFRRMLDGFPSRYMWGGWDKEKEAVRKMAADYINADSEEIALTHNTSEGMNLFARSFDLREGDEIILADHEHPTGVIPYEYYCRPLGVKLVRPVLPLLPSSPEEITEIYRKSITNRTRLISMVHMTNTNGMILPVKMVSELAHSRGLIVCVDGAQAVGMLQISIRDLGCDFYAASGHKWLFGPKGTGLLYAAGNRKEMLKPLMVSSKWSKPDIRMFENYNTRNLPDVLGLGAALEFNNMIGQERKEQRIYSLKRYFRSALSEDKRFIFKTPESDVLSAGIQSVEVSGKRVGDVSAFLSEKYGIDCRPMTSHGLNALRISLSVFNTIDDVDILVRGLKEFASGGEM